MQSSDSALPLRQDQEMTHVGNDKAAEMFQDDLSFLIKFTVCKQTNCFVTNTSVSSPVVYAAAYAAIFGELTGSPEGPALPCSSGRHPLLAVSQGSTPNSVPST